MSPEHMIEFPFTDLTIEIAGVRIDSGLCGTAILKADPGYEFYVSAIVLNGRVREPFPEPGRLSHDWIDGVLRLERPSPCDTSTRAQLFRIIADAIHNSPEAAERWRAECKMAAE